jgi:5'-3' exonuclease
VKNKIGNNIQIINLDANKIISINHDFIKELFIELLWTEKYVWKNMNRDKFSDRDIKEQVDKIGIETKKKLNQMENLNKFISGETANIDCLEKIPFSSGTEYYNYYLGTEDDNIDKNIIKCMVRNYITGMEWCINYYLSDCKSWKWGYNYMIAPLICDIIKYYPKKIFLEENSCELKPIEQLILAIPPDTYKYVLAKKIVNDIKTRKEIGYMFPESFDIDINKESIYWKCQVKIPIVEYEEYINIIKLIEITDEKNISTKIISNYHK